MKNKVLILVFAIVLVAILSSIFFYRIYGISKEEKIEITSVVEVFGSKLKAVDLNAPKEIASSKIRDAYYNFLTPRLLIDWMDDSTKALGRTTSTPWPEKIEIISMRKLDFDFFEFYSSVVEVKGYIAWFASPGKEPFKREPIVLILKRDLQPIGRDNTSYSFQIDNLWHGEYAFYDRKTLLKVLKKAFPNDKDLRFYGLPYIKKSFCLSGNGVSVAFVNVPLSVPPPRRPGDILSSPSNYYTVFLIKNGKLEVANFKDINGDTSPKIFSSNTSIKDSRIFTEVSELGLGQEGLVYNDPGIVFHYNRDRSYGIERDVYADAYIWDGKKFTYNEVFTADVERSLSEEYKNVDPEVKRISSLKFKEIKGKLLYIDTLAVYKDEIAFSSGLDLSQINTITVYNMKNDKVGSNFTINTNTDFVEIGKIVFNEKWILLIVFEDSHYTQKECLAIDRKTKDVFAVVPYNYKGNHAVVTDIALDGDNAYVSMDFYKKKDIILLPSDFISSEWIMVDLTKRDILKSFEGDNEYIVSFGVTDNYLLYLLNEITNGYHRPSLWIEKKDNISPGHEPNPPIKVSGSLINELFPAPKYLSCTPDDYILYSVYQRMLLAPLSNMEKFELLPFPLNQPFEIEATSSNYIACQTQNGNYIFVYNRIMKNLKIFEDPNPSFHSAYGFISIYGNTLAFTEYDYKSKSSIIYLDLKENGF